MKPAANIASSGTTGEDQSHSTASGSAPKTPYTVSVRMRMTENLEGLEAYPDGISFRSPNVIAGGQLVDLVLCGAILVEAEVVGCVRLTDKDGGYLIRARYHKTSEELKTLIHAELLSLIQQNG